MGSFCGSGTVLVRILIWLVSNFLAENVIKFLLMNQKVRLLWISSAYGINALHTSWDRVTRPGSGTGSYQKSPGLTGMSGSGFKKLTLKKLLFFNWKGLQFKSALCEDFDEPRQLGTGKHDWLDSAGIRKIWQTNCVRQNVKQCLQYKRKDLNNTSLHSMTLPQKQ
jgi:hypothetical protein